MALRGEEGIPSSLPVQQRRQRQTRIPQMAAIKNTQLRHIEASPLPNQLVNHFSAKLA